MKTIKTEVGQINIEDVLKGVSQLKVADLESFAKKVLSILETKKAPNLEKKKQDLIFKIKNGGPNADFREKYHFLLQKSVEGKMTNEENRELLKLIPVSEQWATKRLQLIIELAKLENSSVQKIMKQLNISTPPIIHA